MENYMTLVRGNFVNGSAVVYKKEYGVFVKGLQFDDDYIYWLPYFHTGNFHCDRAAINAGTYMGYIDRYGKEIIPPSFLSADDFSEDRAFVSHGNDTMLIDLLGTIVATFDERLVSGKFHNGRAIISRVVCHGKDVVDAIIDRSGNFMVNFSLKRNIFTMADRLALPSVSSWHEGIRLFTRNDKQGVHDRYGNEIVNDDSRNCNGHALNSPRSLSEKRERDSFKSPLKKFTFRNH